MSCGGNETTGYGTTKPEESPGEKEVWMQNTAFNPRNKTISPGTTITWINKDNFAHTITSGTRNSPDGLFDSGNIGKMKLSALPMTTWGLIRIIVTSIRE